MIKAGQVHRQREDFYAIEIDHENGDHSTNAIETQAGTMLTSEVGPFVEYLNNNAGTHAYDDAYGVGVRLMY